MKIFVPLSLSSDDKSLAHVFQLQECFLGLGYFQLSQNNMAAKQYLAFTECSELVQNRKNTVALAAHSLDGRHCAHTGILVYKVIVSSLLKHYHVL